MAIVGRRLLGSNLAELLLVVERQEELLLSLLLLEVVVHVVVFVSAALQEEEGYPDGKLYAIVSMLQFLSRQINDSVMRQRLDPPNRPGSP